MKFAILGGGGAMGGLFGGGLAAAGHDVTLIDVSPAAIAAINGNGLRIEEKSGEVRHVAVRATDDPKSVGVVDAVLNFVKCYHTEAAVRAAAPMIGADTALLTLQNGWGNAETIGKLVGADKVLVGLTYHSGVLAGPGHVRHPGIGMTYIGELSGSETPRLARITEALRDASFEVTTSTSILNEIWKKLALNCCTLPTSALLGLFSHELAAFEPMRDEMRALLGEVKAVAAAQGIALDEDERWATIIGILERGVGGKSSMLQDVEAERRTEIDVINGAIVAAGRRNGVATPHNVAMVNLVKGWEARIAARKAGEKRP
jgi:2-dehydropantoate 2-reductase